MWNAPSIERLAKIPKLYETEGMDLKEKTVHLHFFLGGSDWYAVEYDGKDLFFGYVIINDDMEMAEWGYFSFSELKSIKIKGIEVDFDVWWVERKASEIERIRDANGWKEKNPERVC